MSNFFERDWLIICIILLAILVCGIAILIVNLNGQKYTEITISEAESSTYTGEIYIGGAVASPGYYPVQQGDTVETLIKSAGPAPDADLNSIKIYVPVVGETKPAQRINLNSADVWLLEVLPGIGQDKAQAIVAYRTTQGPFRRIEDLLNVEGIGETTLNRIRNYITIED
jgi:competence protein ComEA